MTTKITTEASILAIVCIVVIVGLVSITTTQSSPYDLIQSPEIVYTSLDEETSLLLYTVLVENTKEYFIQGITQIEFTSIPFGTRLDGIYKNEKIKILVGKEKHIPLHQIAETYCHEILHHHGLVDGLVIEDLENNILCLTNQGLRGVFVFEKG